MAKKQATEAEPAKKTKKPRARTGSRKRVRDLSRKRKLAYLLSREVQRIVDDLEIHEWLLMDVWTSMRVREPLLNVLRARYYDLKPDDLLMLPVECIDLADRFYRTLDAFWLYLRTTEDMPTALSVTYKRYTNQLKQIAELFIPLLDQCHGYTSAFPEILTGQEVVTEE